MTFSKITLIKDDFVYDFTSYLLSAGQHGLFPYSPYLMLKVNV